MRAPTLSTACIQKFSNFHSLVHWACTHTTCSTCPPLHCLGRLFAHTHTPLCTFCAPSCTLHTFCAMLHTFLCTLCTFSTPSMHLPHTLTHLSALHFLGLPPISGLPINLGPLQLPWVTQPQHNQAQHPPRTSVESSPNHPAPIWAIHFAVGWLNPLSHPRTLSSQVTIAKAAPLLTAVSPVAGSHTSLSHGPWVGKFFFLGKTPTCHP